MPIHDWSKVRSGIYHNFHFLWLGAISNHLNAGLLPPGYFAMAEQRVGGPEPDIITLSTQDETDSFNQSSSIQTLPQTTYIERAETVRYARKTNRIAIHHDLGNVVAVMELLSPGNKDTKSALRSFARKSAAMIRNGIHLLVIDPFPPGRYDRFGIHRAIWELITTSEYQPPSGRLLTLASYHALTNPVAYIEPFAVGETIPPIPLFLSEAKYISLNLEAIYQETWQRLPQQIQSIFQESSQ